MDPEGAGAAPATLAEEGVVVGDAYAHGQWAKAFAAAVAAGQDGAARDRAVKRMDQWASVLIGLRTGSLLVGSRNPVRGLPVWVTPEVVRGGFVTGKASAAGPLSEDELALVRARGLRESRRALFEYYLTEAGLQELWSLLDSGTYAIEVAEEAALLTVAWLVRVGEVEDASELVETLRPFAGRLRFLPRPASAGEDSGLVFRQSVGEVVAALDGREVNPRVAVMNETLTVWNPLADELLAHWLLTLEDGQVDRVRPAGWLEAGRHLLATYESLAQAHTRASKHRRPKENLFILRASLAKAVAEADLSPREQGLLQHAVDSMLRVRGAPGSAPHNAVRAEQAVIAARPTHAAIAHLIAARLEREPQESGLLSPEPYLVAVREAESEVSGVPVGTVVPASVTRTVRRARAGTVEDLVAEGSLPSAEVLAQLLPEITAAVAAEAYADPSLRTLVARTYRAFRRRRSLLLVNLATQVRSEELPWVSATLGYRADDPQTRNDALATLLRLAALALHGWPGTPLPNPIVRELVSLARLAGAEVPLVEELAADIFQGKFSPKFLLAAQDAQNVLKGTVYSRYYRLDDVDLAAVRSGRNPTKAFAALCARRADAGGHGWCVVCNGMTIEQAQILTSHNLAALARLGLQPITSWADLTQRSLAQTARLIRRLNGNEHPLHTLKDTAYSWRQTVFYLSMLDADVQAAFLAEAGEYSAHRPGFVRERLRRLIEDLSHPRMGDPLLGWTHGRHPLLPEAR